MNGDLYRSANIAKDIAAYRALGALTIMYHAGLIPECIRSIVANIIEASEKADADRAAALNEPEGAQA